MQLHNYIRNDTALLLLLNYLHFIPDEPKAISLLMQVVKECT